MGRVSFSALGSGFGFLDFARVKLGSSFFVIFQSILPVFGNKLAKFIKKIYFGLLGFLKKLLRSGRVGQKGLGSGFDPTHPYPTRMKEIQGKVSPYSILLPDKSSGNNFSVKYMYTGDTYIKYIIFHANNIKIGNFFLWNTYYDTTK